jgi:hypothetical protein
MEARLIEREARALAGYWDLGGSGHILALARCCPLAAGGCSQPRARQRYSTEARSGADL